MNIKELIENSNLIRLLGDDKNFAPTLPSHLNTLKQLTPGMGYWVNVNTDQDFQYTLP